MAGPAPLLAEREQARAGLFVGLRALPEMAEIGDFCAVFRACVTSLKPPQLATILRLDPSQHCDTWPRPRAGLFFRARVWLVTVRYTKSLERPRFSRQVSAIGKSLGIGYTLAANGGNLQREAIAA
jgi:hypothetical protein